VVVDFKRRQRVRRENLLRAELVHREETRQEEIACWGSGRRGRERVVGPDGRERLPFSGRRAS
jgi:hypothetical protein